jgi:Domain of unknown function (DUF4388)
MSECRASLHGGLDQIGVGTLLTILDMERRSGVLLIRRQGELGRLWLRHGSVVRARVDGLAARSGKAAVYHLLGWSDGRFELTSGDIAVADEIATPTTYLLMEAARRMDEAAAAPPA